MAASRGPPPKSNPAVTDAAFFTKSLRFGMASPSVCVATGDEGIIERKARLG
jgi:hypothetical protein